MARGDHLYVRLELYSHHAIDLGDGNVAHWYGGPKERTDLGTLKDAATIRVTTLAEFAGEQAVFVREYGQCFDADEVVRRAVGCLDQRGYDLVHNNCEHFATWCKVGCHASEQVKDFLALAEGVPAVATGVVGGVGLVAAAGPVAGLGLDGALAGLGAVGRCVGGGPAAGLVALTGAPSLAALGTVHQLIHDDPILTDSERELRAAGRSAALGGAAVGMGTALSAVTAAGLPGLGGAGVVTGLAALGGGSIALGLGAVLAGPAIVSLAAAWLVYRLSSTAQTAAPINTPGTVGVNAAASGSTAAACPGT
jgi:hypothetical protein